MSKIPMDILSYPGAGSANRNLIVFLRGIGRSHRSFKREGFVDGVREYGLPFDMVAPNSHFGYYSDRSLVSRLKADVIDPARQQGYEMIWLVGLSMGGLGTLFYLREYPQDIAGALLIAPFLGNRKMINAIRSRGGVEEWRPEDYYCQEDWQLELWDWIRCEVAAGHTPPVYLGSGLSDDFYKGQQLLSEVLPAGCTFWVDGGHHYSTFVEVWRRFLETRTLELKLQVST
jgi:pimeloyl-ACP methyl ester carboxylesterase